MMGYDGHGFFGGGFMWLLWLLLIFAVVYVFANLVGRGNSSPPEYKDTPLDILKKRYARGEIDEEEYERRRDELIND